MPKIPTDDICCRKRGAAAFQKATAPLFLFRFLTSDCAFCRFQHKLCTNIFTPMATRMIPPAISARSENRSPTIRPTHTAAKLSANATTPRSRQAGQTGNGSLPAASVIRKVTPTAKASTEVAKACTVRLFRAEKCPAFPRALLFPAEGFFSRIFSDMQTIKLPASQFVFRHDRP